MKISLDNVDNNMAVTEATSCTGGPVTSVPKTVTLQGVIISSAEKIKSIKLLLTFDCL